jgi:soluble lytic murein transglycosylase-like protein
MKMKITFVLALTVLSSTVSAFASVGFSAADVPSAKLRKQGKVVISNDDRSINAFHFFGNIKEALVSLRSMRVAATRSFSPAIFESKVPVNSNVPIHLASIFADAGRTHGVDPRLVAAVARRESRFNARAVSPVGACGLMQLMPSTAKYLGVSNVFDARENVFGGARYLRTLLDAFDGDLDLTLAAYNAGPGAVRKYNGVPPFRETRDYVRIVRASYEKSLRTNG